MPDVAGEDYGLLMEFWRDETRVIVQITEEQPPLPGIKSTPKRPEV